MGTISPREKFIRGTVIGIGFLNGLWLHLGFSPGNFLSDFLQKLLLQFDPSQADLISKVFLIAPIVMTSIIFLYIFSRAGFLGILAAGMALYAGYILNIYSIYLMIGALLIAIFATRRFR